MNSVHFNPAAAVTDTPSSTPMKRRGLLIGAGAAGAAVIATQVMPGAAGPVDSAVAAAAITTSGGYQLTAHVQQYYDTARV